MVPEVKVTPLQDLTMTPQVQPITAAEEHQVAAPTVVVPIVLVHLVDPAAEVAAGLQVVAEEDNHISFF